MGRRNKAKKSGKSKHVSYDKELVGVIQKYFYNHSLRRFSDHQLIAHFAGVASKYEIEKILSHLVEIRKIDVDKNDLYGVPLKEKGSKKQLLTGTVDMTQSGNAYVILDIGDSKDIFIHKNNNKAKAFDGDKVSVSIISSRSKTRREGVIEEVIQRKRDTFIGTFFMNNDFAFVVPINEHIPVDFYIHKENFKGAKDQDIVVVKFLRWSSSAKNPYGEVVEVLGEAKSNDLEMKSILIEHGFDLQFSKEALEELKQIPSEIPESEISKRRDFRDVTTFTIDPIDAKDFDDALSIRSVENGLWEIGIHIADVTYYVRENSALEKDAAKRATSVYLVDRVLPMLPERLSNELCSLRPNEDKLCFSAVFRMNEKGDVLHEWFGRTIIHSDRRFSYEEAQEILDGKEDKYADALKILNKIAYKLRDKRFSEGSIGFESTEVRFELDDKAKPIGIILKIRKDAHKLVEDFMLLANKKVALYVGKTKNQNGKNNFVYRIHDLPDEDKLEDFRLFASEFGYYFQFKNPKQISNSFNKFMKEVEGKPEQNVLQNLAIRSMAKAVYSTDNIGHFGLGFEFYTHFTSPIRRYPDMMVHRVLQLVLDGKETPPEAILEARCKHSSEKERSAMEAERESTKFKMAEFMQDRIGEEFDGVVSGVKDWGIYVEIPSVNCEGMAKPQDLKNDNYVFNEKKKQYKGMISDHTISLGDRVRVKVKAVDIAKRIIDLSIIED